MRTGRFEIVETQNSFSRNFQVIVDKETGVNYLFILEGYGAGLTPLLGADGKPIITRKSEA